MSNVKDHFIKIKHLFLTNAHKNNACHYVYKNLKYVQCNNVKTSVCNILPYTLAEIRTHDLSL
jgi:hypothetical protein